MNFLRVGSFLILAWLAAAPAQAALSHATPVPGTRAAELPRLAAEAAKQAMPLPKGACAGCGSVSGSIVAAATGDAIPGAFALLIPIDPAASPQPLFTDAEGAFAAIGNVAPGEYRLHTAANDHVNQLYGGTLCTGYCDAALGAPLFVAADSTAVADFVLSVGGRMSGNVTGPGGAPVTTAYITILPVGGNPFGVGVDAAGHYDTGTVLPPQDYRVGTAGATGLIDERHPDLPCPLQYCEPTLGTPVPVSEGGTSVVDFALVAGARLRGTVTATATGQPVADTYVLIGSADEAFTFGVPTDVDGRFDTSGGLPQGDWHALVHPTQTLVGELWDNIPCSNCMLADGTPIPVTSATDIDGIDFSLDAVGRIEGTVTDAVSGAPIEGANVVLVAADGTPVSSTLSGADGGYAGSAPSVGAFFVQAYVDGYLEHVYGLDDCSIACDPRDGTPVDVQPGTVVDGIDFAMRPGASISGRVTWPDGAPLAAAEIQFYDAEQNLGFATNTDGDGRYAVASLPAGAYQIVAYTAEDLVVTAFPGVECMVDCSDAVRVEMDVGAMRDDVDFAMLEGGHITGFVRADVGQAPIVGAVVNIETLDNYTMPSAQPTGADGRYVSPALPPGEYRVYTRETGGFIDEAYDDLPCTYTCDTEMIETLVVTTGGSVSADFALAAGGRIAGRIAAEGGAALPQRPTAHVLNAEGNTVSSVLASSNGSYVSDGLPTGTYFVRSRNRSGYIDELFGGETCWWCRPPDGTPVAVTVGNTVPDVDFALAPGGRIRGAVTLARNGAPATNVPIGLYDGTGRFIVWSYSDYYTGEWQTPMALVPGTYFLRAYPSYQLLGILYGGAPCGLTCDYTAGVPVQVADGDDVEGIDFALPDGVLFGSGFEAVP